MVVISGGPRLSLRKDSEPLLLHHTLENKQVELEIFRKVTAAAAILADPADAPRQIDGALATCWREHRPVYLEIPMDMVAQPCGEPGPFGPETTVSSDPAALAEAVAAAVEKLTRASNPAVWARGGGPATRGSGRALRVAGTRRLSCMYQHSGQGRGSESLPLSSGLTEAQLAGRMRAR